MQGAAQPELSLQIPTPAETRVFVVDDDAEVLAGVSRFLARQGYDLQTFSLPDACLAAIEEDPPVVLLTDKDMPVMSGLELMEKALEADPSLTIIMMTGGGDEASAQSALRIGAANYLTKPVDLRTLGETMSRAVLRRAEDEYRRQSQWWMKKEVERQRADLEELATAALSALVNALEARFEYFEGHSQHAAETAEAIARQLDLEDDQIEAVRIGGLLHDVGMIAVPDHLIIKPEPLAPEDHAIVALHPQRAADIMEPLEHLADAARYVLEHHELYDGSGYPLGLEGDAISLGGQIVGLSEAWCSLTEARPHRRAFAPSDAMAILARDSGTRYQPRLIEALRASQGL